MCIIVSSCAWHVLHNSCHLCYDCSYHMFMLLLPTDYTISKSQSSNVWGTHTSVHRDVTMVLQQKLYPFWHVISTQKSRLCSTTLLHHFHYFDKSGKILQILLAQSRGWIFISILSYFPSKKLKVYMGIPSHLNLTRTSRCCSDWKVATGTRSFHKLLHNAKLKL